MPHSNFKSRSYEINTGFGKCTCGHMELKCKLHLRFCKSPPKGEQKVGIPMKATTFMEYQACNTKRRREVHN